LYILSLPTEAKGRCLEIVFRDHGKIKFYASIATISSFSFEAIGLKFGKKIHLINAMKLVGQIFEIFILELR